MARLRQKSAGRCVECKALVALRDDRSCPSCGLVDALRPIPGRLQVKRPRLSHSVVYTATKVTTYCVIPILAFLLVYSTVSSSDDVLLFVYSGAVGVGLIAGLLLGPALGALLAHLPWLAAQAISYGLVAPWQKLRSRRRAAPTFQGALEKLAAGKAQLEAQLAQMKRTLSKVRETLAGRDASAQASRQRLLTAEQALIAGIQARREGLEAIDAVSFEVKCQKLECEIAAVSLLAASDPQVARAGLGHLKHIEEGLREVAPPLRDPARAKQVSQAIGSVKDKLRAARDRLHAVEDGGLLEQAAALLGDVQPVHEHHRVAPQVGSFDVPDMGTQLLRIDAAVTQCLEQRLRVEAEREAVAEVDALAEMDAPAGAPRRSARS